MRKRSRIPFVCPQCHVAVLWLEQDVADYSVALDGSPYAYCHSDTLVCLNEMCAWSAVLDDMKLDITDDTILITVRWHRGDEWDVWQLGYRRSPNLK